MGSSWFTVQMCHFLPFVLLCVLCVQMAALGPVGLGILTLRRLVASLRDVYLNDKNECADNMNHHRGDRKGPCNICAFWIQGLVAEAQKIRATEESKANEIPMTLE